MLIRQEHGDTLAIGQPSHAWLSGQLARAWGNDRFGEVQPVSEVCLAADQHDAGWGRQDLSTVLNPQTGRPRSFLEMPLATHLQIFTDGPLRMVPQSRYAALLVSLHGWRLYSRRDLSKADPEQARAIRRFLDAQREFQGELLETLRGDPHTAAFAQPEVVERNSKLVWTWDYLSLAICLGWNPATAKGAPTADGEVDLELRADASGRSWRVDPWPFSADCLTVRCEARRLEGSHHDEAALREAFARSPWETLEFRLERG